MDIGHPQDYHYPYEQALKARVLKLEITVSELTGKVAEVVDVVAKLDIKVAQIKNGG